MKNLLKLGMALLIAAMLFGITGCFEPEDDDAGKKLGGVSGVDFTNAYGQNAALNFRNRTNTNLVLFKGQPRTNTLLGGIGISDAWGIPRNPTLLTKPEAFLAFVVTEDQYIQSKNNLQALDNAPFVKFYVFYNHDTGENDTHYEISKIIGGSNRYVTVVTPPNAGYNVEVRLNGTSGPTLGYAQSGMLTTKLYIQPDEDCYLFPVFNRWNSVRQILQTTYPLRGDGKSLYTPVALTATTPEISMNLSTIMSNTEMKIDLGAAYLYVVNNVRNGGITLYDGTGNPIRNSIGVSIFSDNRVFEVKMFEGALSDASAMPKTRRINDWVLGSPLDQKPIYKEGDPTVTTFDLANGKMYTINAQGDYYSQTEAGLPYGTLDFDNPTDAKYEDDTQLPS